MQHCVPPLVAKFSWWIPTSVIELSNYKFTFSFIQMTRDFANELCKKHLRSKEPPSMHSTGHRYLWFWGPPTHFPLPSPPPRARARCAREEGGGGWGIYFELTQTENLAPLRLRTARSSYHDNKWRIMWNNLRINQFTYFSTFCRHSYIITPNKFS